jgi:CRP-like cAMP-binding protein
MGAVVQPQSADQTTKPPANHLLASLAPADSVRLGAMLNVLELKQGTVLCEPGDEIEHVYFPHSGMISLLAVMRDGKAVETATIGCEGVVGAMAGFGAHVMLTRAVVQTPLVASRIAAAPFRDAARESDTLRDLIMRYSEALLGQVQMTAACNALHSLSARLARWILQTQDRVNGPSVPLTQELLSEMLGVRRSSVSEVAHRLQTRGLIRYHRGSIEIIDRKALELACCECYQTIKAQTDNLLR